MSAIAGLYSPVGQPVSSEQVDAMIGCLRHRGPDWSATWQAGPVGLGCACLWTTPESQRDWLPLATDADRVVLTADARIDNRPELLAALRLPASADEVITDGELIVRAYQRWGLASPARLIGDFAIAIWDVRQQRLFCARDHVGAKPFYYYHSPKLFAFASEIKAIVSLPTVPRCLNEERLADYIAQVFEDRTATVYKGILRLPPAHCLVVDAVGIRCWPYWTLDQKHELSYKRDEEYVEAFREVFDQAVEVRLRSAYPVASTLSGGLDSSSIACTACARLEAAGKTLHTFSAVFPGLPEPALRQIDERGYIQAVLAAGRYKPHLVPADELNPLADLDQIFWHQDELVLAPNLYLHRAMYRAARQAGVRVFLDGIDGDTTVSHGLERLADLARSVRWLTLVTEATALSRKPGVARRPARLIWLFGIRPLLPEWLLGGVRRRLSNGLGDWARGTAINPAFAARLSYERRAARWARSRPRSRTAREKHYAAMTAGLIPLCLEVLDHAASEFGLETRYPFFDRRLMEFCLSLPSAQKFGQGWARWIQRRAMAGRLPADVQWRFRKADLSPNLAHGLLETGRSLVDAGLKHEALSAYYDLSELEAAYRRFHQARALDQDGLAVYGAVMMGHWLRHVRSRGVRPAQGDKEVLSREITKCAFRPIGSTAQEDML